MTEEETGPVAHELGPVARRVLAAPARLYDWRLGWLLGRRFLRLTHTGRRSRRRHQTVLEVIGSGPVAGEVLVIAGLGRSANWYRNIQSHPTADVTIGRRHFRAVHRELTGPEAIAALADYEHRNRYVRPLIRRVLSWLVGWEYDGSDDARRRLVGQLPVIAFRPGYSPAPERRLAHARERHRLAGAGTGQPTGKDAQRRARGC